MNLDLTTPLLTRSELHSALEELAAKSQSIESPVSLLLIDMDNFKAFNDIYGHDRGDDLLHSVAKIIQAECGVGPFLARLGGDEFVAIFQATELQLAHDTAERIRATVAATEHCAGKHKVTVSIGVATSIPYLRWASNSHLQLAELRLVVAKKRLNSPKNRVWSGQLPTGWLQSLGSLRWWPSSPALPDH